MTTLRKVFSLFTRGERLRLIPLGLGVLFMAFLEVAGIGSIGPFIAVASDPGIIETQPILRWAYEVGGFETARSFIIALGAGAFGFMVVATAFRMLVNYFLFRYLGHLRYSLGLRLFRQYLYQPYTYFLDHNTSELSKNLLSEVDKVVNGVLQPGTQAFAKAVVAAFILVFLVAVNPWVAFASALVFGILYMVLFGLVRNPLLHYGREIRDANRVRYKAAGEAFGAIKDVKVMGKEPAFARLYAYGARRYARTQAAKQILSRLPQQSMQTLAKGFAIALVIVLLTIHGTVAQALPLLAVYTLAVQRLIPNIKTVFRGASQVRYYGPIVDALHSDMTGMPPAPRQKDKKLLNNPVPVLPFNEHIRLEKLTFSYPSSDEAVLSNINLEIPKNTTVGFVGPTGCGKTTLVDIIMGLLEPVSGQVLVDGKPVEDPRSWQRNFGYVPQQIFLSDDSVAANIAFGVPEDERDQQAVERAARIANLHDFVVNELPEGYATTVGERGIRFSGGQRQRVGIARALYNDPDILVLDEATSALDTVTEDAVMDAIHSLMHTKTILLIAHRISTVRECDHICMLDGGALVASGSYDELLDGNSAFRAMAKV